MILEDEENCYIKAYGIDDFTDVTKKRINFNDMQAYKEEIVNTMRRKFS